MLNADALVPAFLFLGCMLVVTGVALSVRRVKGWHHDKR
jgi:hypothetical protein